MENNDVFAPCVDEFSTLLHLANFTLWLGIIAAIVISLLTLIERISALRKKSLANESGGAAPIGSLLDSLKGLIGALAAAPPWFAIFLAGVLLLWCAGRFTPTECHQRLTAPAHAAS